MKRIRNAIRYIVLILLNIIVMAVFHSYLNFILLVGLVLFPIYSIVGVYMARDSLSLRIEAPVEPMVRGEEFEVRFIIHNNSWFPIINVNLLLEFSNCFYARNGSHILNIPVRAKRDTRITYPIVMEYCGKFQVDVTEITLMDVLGVVVVKLPVNEAAECLVVPNGAERNKEAGLIYFRGVTEAMESKDKGYDFSDISGIREYIPGDKLQNIHWKLSVKKDELMVKERVSVSAMQLNVLVDVANNDEMCAEGVLELADSITKAFVLQNLPFTVYYYSTNTGSLRSSYIGNEIERVQWIEMMLYDVCYGENISVEDMFLHEYQGAGSYLYIGRAIGDVSDEDVIYGEKGTSAVLKTRG
ncbi:MAG: DUF58 domain-containing protein [Lachnospiraceae bacterium]|nr:DUF58 domain-containing protein [Lachnospiraceae bacterium]